MEAAPPIALIADDDEFFRIALKTILKNELDFAEVIETGSLDEAIEQLSDRDDVALALFDLAMPGMESAASLEAVRDVHEDMRVAVVSASTNRTDILTALAAGVHGYVPKGLGATELATAIRHVLGGAIYVPPAIAGRAPSATDIKVVSSGNEPPGEPDSKAIDFLTPRQREVLILLVEGLSNKEIARKLRLGEGTVKIHMAALFRGLGVRNRQSAAAAGARLLPDLKKEED
ncbi:response regulator [Chelativorans salis]|uniref:Response regulator transcription factor n=1 Tax=Chelativorans salis TaxID=2978478 RepID=A0ABT2LIL6_9HYPH|nr:response regulator transcription factor [Chelativorans sp. EGI FJ00035]MCT7374370.1 response regulator transcription factor [Chelativorans sp. EGI FJ00035]